MIQKSIITASSFSYDNQDYTRVELNTIVPGCGIPRGVAVLTYDPDPVADASPTWSAYKMKCELCGVEPGMDEREFAVYKYLTEGNK